MKSSEFVFELVLLPSQYQFTTRLTFPEDVLGEGSAAYDPESTFVTRTFIRVSDMDSLSWCVRAVNMKLWGLVGKSRFFLFNLKTAQFYSLFIKDEAVLTGKSWRLNEEITRYFTKRVALKIPPARIRVRGIKNQVENKALQRPEFLLGSSFDADYIQELNNVRNLDKISSRKKLKRGLS